MKSKKHFFYLDHSLVNTLFFVVGFSASLVFFIISLIIHNLMLTICMSVLLSLSLFIGIIYLIFDGWAFWQINKETIFIHKLFVKTKSILICEIISIDECILQAFIFNCPSEIECYCFFDGKTKIKVPKSKYSDELVEEIKMKSHK